MDVLLSTFINEDGTSGLQIIFFSYKEKCPAKTQSWLHKMKFWSGHNQKKVNEL